MNPLCRKTANTWEFKIFNQKFNLRMNEPIVPLIITYFHGNFVLDEVVTLPPCCNTRSIVLTND